MSDENKALVPVDQRVVMFYDDEVQGVVVSPTPSERIVYVPIRPLCNYLGIAWTAQRQRILRDPVLSEELRPVIVTITGTGQEVESLCLPLDFLNGWLFGINASRVKEEVRERLIRYQRECYRVLSEAFGTREHWREPDALGQVEEFARALLTLAREQREFNRELGAVQEEVESLASRLVVVEDRTAPGQPVSDQQAAQISQAVKAIAMLLSKRSGRNEYGGVYGELYRRFSITSYKLLPATKYADAMEFLRSWWEEVAGGDEIPF